MIKSGNLDRSPSVASFLVLSHLAIARKKTEKPVDFIELILVGDLEHFLFFHFIYGMSSFPFDELHHFSEE